MPGKTSFSRFETNREHQVPVHQHQPNGSEPMATPRKLNPAQPGRKGSKGMMYEPDAITEPPSHFPELHCQLWACTVAFPSFKPTDANYAELRNALESHIVYCNLITEIRAMRKNGEKPTRALELARDAARRPYTRFLKRLVT
jgi:hypothetical protein